MSRWAERLKSKYANADSANSANSPLSAPNGAIGNGTFPETDPADWQGEVEPEPSMAVRYWCHGEVRGAPRLAIVPAGRLFNAADWLDGQGLGPVAIIEESGR